VHGLGEGVGFFPARTITVEGTELKRLIGVSLIPNIQLMSYSLTSETSILSSFLDKDS